MTEDLISRQAVLDAFDCSIGGVPAESVKYVSEYANKMMSRINALPPAQPEIIHCRNCRYSVDFYKDGCCYCMREFNGMRYIEEGFGFYCAGAERRTDE